MESTAAVIYNIDTQGGEWSSYYINLSGGGCTTTENYYQIAK